jgi:hypothetical protein
LDIYNIIIKNRLCMYSCIFYLDADIGISLYSFFSLVNERWSFRCRCIIHKLFVHSGDIVDPHSLGSIFCKLLVTKSLVSPSHGAQHKLLESASVLSSLVNCRRLVV